LAAFARFDASRIDLSGCTRSRSASILATFSANESRALSRRPAALAARMSEMSG